MYAVISTGGKQYRVATGDVIKVEKLNVEQGQTVELDQVLMVANNDKINVGDPLLKNSTVEAVVKSQGRGKKVRIIKMRRRKHYRKQMGHRQSFTELEIKAINA